MKSEGHAASRLHLYLPIFLGTHAGQPRLRFPLERRCEKAFHTYCLVPPLEGTPEGPWTCPVCLSEATEGWLFRDGEHYTLADFEESARSFARAFWGQNEDKASGARQLIPAVSFVLRLSVGGLVRSLVLRLTAAPSAPQISWADMEREFWRIVEEGEEPVEVVYGADLDTGVLGSGFPTRPGQVSEGDEHYLTDGWNLNNFPRLAGRFGSMLRHVDDSITVGFCATADRLSPVGNRG